MSVLSRPGAAPVWLLLVACSWALTAAEFSSDSGGCDVMNSFCEQLCIPATDGSYHCACKEGYSLHDNNYSCFVTPTDHDRVTWFNTFVTVCVVVIMCLVIGCLKYIKRKPTNH